MKDVLKRKEVQRTEYIFMALILIPFFMLYLYHDVCHTTSRGIVFWNALFEGNISQFYNYPYPGVEGSWLPNGTMGGAYDLGLYIIFALWDFPLWCFEKITGISFLSVYFGRLYAKSISLFFLLLSACIVKKITYFLTEKDEVSSWAVFCFLSSSLTVNTIVLMGGYDIISVFFSLLGLYYYLREEDWKFLLSFVIAMTCKMFALFIVIPLILLRYKDIGKVIKKALIGISIIAIPKLVAVAANLVKRIYSLQNIAEQNVNTSTITSNDVIAHSNIVNKQMFAGNGAAISFSQMSIFFMATFALWWFCWKKKDTTKYEVLYYCLVAMSIFALCVKQASYWIILLVPYIILVMLINADKFRDNVILEMLLSVSFIIERAYYLYWCYSYNLFNKMFGIYPSNDKEYIFCLIPRVIDNLSEKIGISAENICSLFTGIFATGVILFLYDNRPTQLKCEEIDYMEIRQYSWIRMFPAVGVAAIPIMASLFF